MHVAVGPYIPGLSADRLARDMGIKNAIKLASNESVLGPSQRALAALAATPVHLYPDDQEWELKSALARHHGVKEENIAVGNGSTELVSLLVRVFLREGDALLNAWPSFVWYRMAAARDGREELTVPLAADFSYDLARLVDEARRSKNAKLVFLATPNNPTGAALAPEELARLLEALPRELVVAVDAAYAEYARDRQAGAAVLRMCLQRENTVVLRTFSKAFGLAALRVGYAIGDPAVIRKITSARDPFATNAVGQRAATASLEDLAHVARAADMNDVELPRLSLGLADRGFFVWPSAANFVLARVKAGESASAVADRLLRRGVIVRTLPSYGLEDCLRITVGGAADHERLFAALDADTPRA